MYLLCLSLYICSCPMRWTLCYLVVISLIHDFQLGRSHSIKHFIWIWTNINSDKSQFSPNNISTWSWEKVMRINKMITKAKLHWSFIKFCQLILWGNVHVRTSISLENLYVDILGLKGLISNILELGVFLFVLWWWKCCPIYKKQMHLKESLN